MSWLDDPRLWIPLGGIAAHAVITWWKVGVLERESAAQRVQIDSFREWRAQVREQIRQLRSIHGSGEQDYEEDDGR